MLCMIELVFQNQWSSVFCGIVSRAMTLEVLSTGVAGNYNGALQVVIDLCSKLVQLKLIYHKHIIIYIFFSCLDVS